MSGNLKRERERERERETETDRERERERERREREVFNRPRIRMYNKVSFKNLFIN